MCSSIFPTFPSIRFSVCSFMVRSLIHRDLSFVQMKDMDQFTLFYMQTSSLTSITWERSCLFPVCIYGFFIKNYVFILVWSFVYVFNSNDQHVCLYPCVMWFWFQKLCCTALRSGMVINPAALFLFQLFSDFLFFCMNSITFLSSYVKNCAAVFIGIAFNLQIASVAWLFIQC